MKSQSLTSTKATEAFMKSVLKAYGALPGHPKQNTLRDIGRAFEPVSPALVERSRQNIDGAISVAGAKFDGVTLHNDPGTFARNPSGGPVDLVYQVSKVYVNNRRDEFYLYNSSETELFGPFELPANLPATKRSQQTVPRALTPRELRELHEGWERNRPRVEIG